MSAPTIRRRRDCTADGHRLYSVVINGERVGYVWKDGNVWHARLAGSVDELPGRWVSRQHAAEYVAGVRG